MTRMSRNVFLIALAVLPAATASAQNINVDIGTQPVFSPVPSPAYSAAAVQPGAWNGVSPTIPVPAPLNDLSGVLTNVTLARTGGAAGASFDNAATVGDDAALLDDYQQVGPVGSNTTWTFAGLATGDYTLYTYAWSPIDPAARSTVSGGTISPPQICGGPWTGMHQLGGTYTTHHFSITGGTALAVTITTTTGAGALGGFQLVQAPPPGVYFCFGDGSGAACPAGNFSQPGAQAGCLNSLGVGGLIEATGTPSLSNDTLHFHGSNMTFSSCLYFQGNNQVNGGAGTAFGDGLLCTNGSVVRLAIKLNGHGSSNYPDAGDPPVSAQGMVSTPGFKYYEVWYRDAAPFGTASTFNTTRTVCIPWVP